MSAEVEKAAGRREDDGPALGPTSDACWLAAARRFEANEVRTSRSESALPICERYLVDPASSHMLDSKTKPCMYKYMHFLLQNRGWLIKSVEVP